jgi:hypothetical protein
MENDSSYHAAKQRTVRTGQLKQLPIKRTNSSRELTLPLLVARVAADHVHRPLTAHNLAIFTNSLDAGTDFHDG